MNMGTALIYFFFIFVFFNYHVMQLIELFRRDRGIICVLLLQIGDFKSAFGTFGA